MTSSKRQPQRCRSPPRTEGSHQGRGEPTDRRELGAEPPAYDTAHGGFGQFTLPPKQLCQFIAGGNDIHSFCVCTGSLTSQNLSARGILFRASCHSQPLLRCSDGTQFMGPTEDLPYRSMTSFDGPNGSRSLLFTSCWQLSQGRERVWSIPLRVNDLTLQELVI